MKNKETGEFELVVGDKQLLSGFFIGVLLLAVVFLMGYALGQSTPKSAKVAPETAVIPNSTSDHPSPASPAAAASPEPAAATPAERADSKSDGAARAEAPPQPTTVPARDTSVPAPPKATPAADLAAGNYWQVLAASQTSADAMTQSLKGQGFPVITRPGPNNLTLVWVGPYTDKDTLSRAKQQLLDAGIKTLYKKP